MDLKQKFTEGDEVFEMSMEAALFVANNFDDDTLSDIFDSVETIDYPGDNVDTSWAISINNDLFFVSHIRGLGNKVFLLKSFEIIDDIDIYLDYINIKKAIKWNTDTMMSTRF
jgi:hypothetical protein